MISFGNWSGHMTHLRNEKKGKDLQEGKQGNVKDFQDRGYLYL